MQRRAFLSAATIGAAASTVAAPAIAQSEPAIKWRLVSSYPKSLDTIFGGAEYLAKRVSEATEGKFQIRSFAAGEIVPGLQVLDAVQTGTVECGQTASAFYIGKDPTFAFDTAMPCGFNARQHMAWMAHGGGAELMGDFFREYKIVAFAAGNTGAQMGGFFRKEIKTVEDLNGLKFRISGMGGQVMSRLGVVAQQIAGGDVYPALERGTIDAAEFVGPHDDEKLGLHKVAKYYYYPGFWEGCAQISLMVNGEKWSALPAHYKAVLRAACAEVNSWMLAKYDADNMTALKRMVQDGVQLRPFPRDVLTAGYKSAYDLYDEIAGKNDRFRTVYQSWQKFLADEYLWFRVAEIPYDAFMAGQIGTRKL